LVFIKNLFLNSIWLILTYKLKLNCRDATCHSYDVIELVLIILHFTR